MKRTPRFLLAAILSLLASPVYSVTVTYQNGSAGYSGCNDTYIQSNQATTNMGTQAAMIVGVSGGGSLGSRSIKRILIKFDVSAIPAGSKVTSAKLYLDSTTSVSANFLFECHLLTSDWVENSATWNTYDGIDPWVSRGGDFDPSVIASSYTFENGWHAWAVTSVVQQWVDYAASNYGLIIKSGDESLRNQNYYISSNFSASGNRPKLVITYGAADAVPPAAVSDLSAAAGLASVTLKWTAPGNDGNTGNITGGQYLVKYTTSGQISDDNAWTAAPYQVTLATSTSPGNPETALINGLKGGTTYWFALKTVDDTGNISSLSNSVKVVPSADLVPPVLSSITVFNVFDSTVSFRWSTNKLSSGRIKYGFTSSYGSTTSSDSFSLSHCISITGLTQKTTYHYQVVCVDLSSNQAVSPDGTFVTARSMAVTSEYIWLSVKGNRIIRSLLCDDPEGTWMAAGVAHRYDYVSEATNMTVNQGKVNWAASNHANIVRISMNNIIDFTSGADCVSSYLAPLINMYKAQKIYVIIDSHYYMHDDPNYLTSSAGALWDVSNPSTYVQRWLADWAYIANYFKNEPWVAGYELCNEPVGDANNPLTQAQIDIIRNNYMVCISSYIRPVDTRHIVFVGSPDWSHTVGIKGTWEINLPAAQQYNPDPDYKQVVFSFHEYTKAYPLYASAGGYVNDEIGRIKSTYNVPLLCTEFGHDDVYGGCTTAEIRQFEQEMIEMCYGKPNFWQGAPISDPAYPSRGTPASSRVGWILWRMAGTTASSWATTASYTDIWPYAANIQGSPAPNPIADPTPPSGIAEVRDGTGADIAFTMSSTTLSANWDPADDTESGISRYVYSIGTSPGATDIISWADNGIATVAISTGLSLNIGTTYYFSVMAQNGSKLYNNPENSNGQVVLRAPPPPVIKTITVPAYPNPFSYSKNPHMTFSFEGNAGGTIKIFTVNGKQVRKLIAQSGPSVAWDGLNESGQKLAPGIYLYTISQPNIGRITGKLAVK